MTTSLAIVNRSALTNDEIAFAARSEDGEGAWAPFKPNATPVKRPLFGSWSKVALRLSTTRS